MENVLYYFEIIKLFLIILKTYNFLFAEFHFDGKRWIKKNHYYTPHSDDFQFLQNTSILGMN